MSEETVYITTSIPFVNSTPHLGFAYELVLADVLARHAGLRGRTVRYQTGSDENSLKNVRAAQALNVDTGTLVARNAEHFRDLRESLDLSWDDFIRTSSDSRHPPAVAALWQACERNGDIERRAYRGLYCVGCEQFHEEGEDGNCPVHGTRLEEVCEENYFFRLSRFSQRLIRLIESGELRIEPAVYRSEVLQFIRRGLRDFSISRSRSRAHGWGIPVPGDPDQIVYVWFDALANYISALGWPEESDEFRRYWCESQERVHVIGKDVTRFHAICWPAILLSAGLPLPRTLFVHGFITVGGRKISKSKGQNVDPSLLAADFGSDALRYYLLRHGRIGQDWDFNRDALLRAYNAELADDLGNLVCRSLRLVEKFAAGVVPEVPECELANRPLKLLGRDLSTAVDEAVQEFRTDTALTAIWRLIAEANRFIETTKPWVLAKGQGAESQRQLNAVLYDLVQALGLIAFELTPFLPFTARALAEGLGIAADEPRRSARTAAWGGLRPGASIPWCETGAPILFPKREEAKP